MFNETTRVIIISPWKGSEGKDFEMSTMYFFFWLSSPVIKGWIYLNFINWGMIDNCTSICRRWYIVYYMYIYLTISLVFSQEFLPCVNLKQCNQFLFKNENWVTYFVSIHQTDNVDITILINSINDKSWGLKLQRFAYIYMCTYFGVKHLSSCYHVLSKIQFIFYIKHTSDNLDLVA